MMDKIFAEKVFDKTYKPQHEYFTYFGSEKLKKIFLLGSGRVGKTSDSGSEDRGFKSYLPSHFCL